MIITYTDAPKGLELTHLDIKPNGLWQFLEQIFQSRKRGLDVIPSAIAFEPFLLEVTGMLHLLAHSRGVVFLAAHRHRPLFPHCCAPEVLDLRIYSR
jgi:hypothetical protein